MGCVAVPHKRHADKHAAASALTTPSLPCCDRDVKPDNFLFLNPAEDAPLKMIDFGLAEYCEEVRAEVQRGG